jgi:phage terminase large subunit-like protein
LTVTEGDVIDYQRVYAEIEEDCAKFPIVTLEYDPWSSAPVIQEVCARARLRDEQAVSIAQTFAAMTLPMNELMSALKSGTLVHGGNPVARWNADSVEVRSPADNPDLVRPVKPQRLSSGKRVDGIVALAMALGGWRRAQSQEYDVLESVW